jgi:hypothetical protein
VYVRKSTYTSLVYHYLQDVNASHVILTATSECIVKEAVMAVDASSIAKMVSMRASNKPTEQFMVHALVLWKVDIVNGDGYEDNPRFELVSHYAERLVAHKLAVESAAY